MIALGAIRWLALRRVLIQEPPPSREILRGEISQSSPMCGDRALASLILLRTCFWRPRDRPPGRLFLARESTMSWHDDDPELDESEFPEPDPEESGSIDLVPCPHCRQSIYEEAERCRECGNYISREDGPLGLLGG